MVCPTTPGTGTPMAANPRTIVTARPGSDVVTLTEHDGNPASVLVSDLIRQELIAAAKIAYPDVNGQRWLRCGNDAIRRALTDLDLPDSVTAETPAPVSNGTARKVKRRARSEPAPEPEALAEQVTSYPPAMHLLLEMVRPLVAEEVRRALSGVRLVTDQHEED
jgi:hypothetical protein